ncbi:MAG TPA: sialidase family protein [Acidimicrobiales bacterium]|nr:sialidase family protein [Acidimicrobiales bacterium]
MALLAVGAALTAPGGAVAQQPPAGGPSGPVSGKQGPVVLPARQVSTDLRPGRAYNQPQLAIDPTDERTIVIAGANYNAGECLNFLSLDGGATWRPGKALARPPQYKTCVRPDLGPYIGAKFGADGTLFLTSAADNAGGQQIVNDLYVARSEDLGDSWDFAIAHKGRDAVEFTQLDGAKKMGGEHFSLVRMGTDPKDPRYVYAGARYQHADRSAPYGTFGVIPIRNMIAASSDGGRTFGPLVDPMAGVPRNEMYGAYVPSISVGPDGTVYAFTRERTPPADPNNPAGPSTPPGVAGAGGRLLMSTSKDHGATWTVKSIDDSPVTCGSRDRCQWIPEGTVDPNSGRIYVVFAQADTATSDTNIWFKSSGDGGATWSDRKKLNDDDTNLDQYFPGVSVAPNGRVDVAWHDFRNDRYYQPASTFAEELYWDAYHTSSADGGVTWTQNIRVSDRSMHKNEGYTLSSSYGLMGPIGIASTDGAAHIAWGDSRRGTVQLPTEDYYFTSVVYDPEQLATAGSDDPERPAAWFALGAAVMLGMLGAVLLIVSRRIKPTD